MKLKLDENIPRSTAPRLAALGYDVDTVLDEQLGVEAMRRFGLQPKWRTASL